MIGIKWFTGREAFIVTLGLMVASIIFTGEVHLGLVFGCLVIIVEEIRVGMSFKPFFGKKSPQLYPTLWGEV